MLRQLHVALTRSVPPQRDVEACCVVPQRALVAFLADTITSLGATSVASIGSGSALLEWLLAGLLPPGTPVLCIDPLYSEHKLSRCVAPVQQSRSPRGGDKETPVRCMAPPSLEAGPGDVLEGLGLRPIGLGWGHVAVEGAAAMLWAWGKCDEACFRRYLESYRGGIVVVLAACEVWCMPSIEDMAEALLQKGQGAGGWRLHYRGACETLGRPTECAIFIHPGRVPRVPR